MSTENPQHEARVPVGDWKQLLWRRLDEATAELAKRPLRLLLLLVLVVRGPAWAELVIGRF